MLKLPQFQFRAKSSEEPRRSFWMGPFLGLFAAFLFLLFWPDLFKNFEYRTLDFRFQLRKPQPPSEKIKIVGITDQDLDIIGEWPWDRAVHQLLIEALEKFNVKCIVFDIQFPKVEGGYEFDLNYYDEIIKNSTDTTVKHQYREAKMAQLNDLLLVEATEKAGMVFHNYTLDVEAESGADIPSKSVARLQSFMAENYGKPYTPSKYVANLLVGDKMKLPIPELITNKNNKKTSAGLGFINVVHDSDGILRRTPLVALCRNRLYPSLDLIVMADYFNCSWLDGEVSFGKEIYLPSKSGKNKDLRIPVDEKGEMAINFRGGKNYLAQAVSYAQVLAAYDAVKTGSKPVIDIEKFKNCIVLVGMIAEGTPDIDSVPDNYAFPLVALHAQVLENILHSDYLRSVSRWMEVIFIIALGFLIGCLLIRLSIWQDVAVTLDCLFY